MSISISTNTAALRAGTALAVNQSRLQKSFDRLSSGKKLASRLITLGTGRVDETVCGDQPYIRCSKQCTKCNFIYGSAGRHARHSGQDRRPDE